MAYASYEFYKTEYEGTAIPEAAWKRLSAMADNVLDGYTYGRICEADTAPNCAALAACAVAETLYAHQGKKEHRADDVKSENTDGYSVTFESSDEIDKRHRREILSAVDMYLPRSHPLRYAGVS